MLRSPSPVLCKSCSGQYHLIICMSNFCGGTLERMSPLIVYSGEFSCIVKGQTMQYRLYDKIYPLCASKFVGLVLL